MNRDTKIRFMGLEYSGPAHILGSMNDLIKTYPSETDPVVLENERLKKELAEIKESPKKKKGVFSKGK